MFNTFNTETQPVTASLHEQAAVKNNPIRRNRSARSPAGVAGARLQSGRTRSWPGHFSHLWTQFLGRFSWQVARAEELSGRVASVSSSESNFVAYTSLLHGS